MIHTVIFAVAVLVSDYSLIGAGPVAKKKEVKWPPVYLNVLGYKGCKKCIEMSPAIRALKKAGYPIFYWDIDLNPQLPKQFKTKGRYPHIALVIDGIIVQQHDGVLCAEALADWYRHGVNVRAGKEKLDPAMRYTPFTFPGKPIRTR